MMLEGNIAKFQGTTVFSTTTFAVIPIVHVREESSLGIVFETSKSNLVQIERSRTFDPSGSDLS
jgi:hypothetical protein